MEQFQQYYKINSLPTILHVLADVISFCLRSAQDRIDRPQDWHRWAFPSGFFFNLLSIDTCH